MLFSATSDSSLKEFTQHIVKNPIVIKLTHQQESLQNTTQYYVRCNDQNQKYEVIQNICEKFKNTPKIIVYCDVILI